MSKKAYLNHIFILLFLTYPHIIRLICSGNPIQKNFKRENSKLTGRKFMEYKIKDVMEQLGMTVHTVRHYCDNG